MDEKLKCPHKRIDHNQECLDCDEPVWVGGDELLEDALVHLKGANESGDPAAWIDHAIEKIETRLKSPRPIPGLQEAKLISVKDKLPPFEDGLRVIIHTEGYDFNGEQFFDVKATDLYEGDGPYNGYKLEICEYASHWMPLPAAPRDGRD